MARRVAVALAALFLFPGGARAQDETVQDVGWNLVHVSPSGRLLYIGHELNTCGGTLRITPIETPTTVRLLVQNHLPPPPNYCPAWSGIGRTPVLLSEPLNGRALETITPGFYSPWKFTGAGSPEIATAPRLVGVRGVDAALALRNWRQQARIVGPPEAKVLRQRPAPGQPMPRGLTLVTDPTRPVPAFPEPDELAGEARVATGAAFACVAPGPRGKPHAPTILVTTRRAQRIVERLVRRRNLRSARVVRIGSRWSLRHRREVAEAVRASQPVSLFAQVSTPADVAEAPGGRTCPKILITVEGRAGSAELRDGQRWLEGVRARYGRELFTVNVLAYSR